MAAERELHAKTAMASRWRRRRMCVLLTDRPVPAGLRDVSATRIFLETNTRPELGAIVELHHPEAGAIRGRVSAVALDGITLTLPGDEVAMAFALAAIAADMTA